MGQDLPTWAQRSRREREVHGWSQSEAVAILQAHGDHQTPGQASLLRRWKSWETGEHLPNDRYQVLIATMFGSARYAIFPAPSTEARDGALIAATVLDKLAIVSRLRSSDVDQTSLDALAVTVDRLCTEYSYVPAEQLLVDGRIWLGHVADLRNRRLTLAQHREVLTLAGWLALLGVRRERPRRPGRGRSNPPRGAQPWPRVGQRRDRGMGARDACLVRSDGGRLPYRDRCRSCGHGGGREGQASRSSSPPRRPRPGHGSATVARSSWRRHSRTVTDALRGGQSHPPWGL